jgi:two-component system response regulator ChvI
MAGDGEIGFRTNVRAFIKRIRQKFRDVDPQFSRIKNYPGFGYRWLDGPEQ